MLRFEYKTYSFIYETLYSFPLIELFVPGPLNLPLGARREDMIDR